MSSKPIPVTGRCECGAIRYKAELKGSQVDACHCGMCRRLGAGPFFSVNANQPVAFEGENALEVYVSSDWAERGFCKRCGTSLFYRMRNGQHGSLNPFTIEDSVDFTFAAEIFVDDKPDFYSIGGAARSLTGREAIEEITGAKDS